MPGPSMMARAVSSKGPKRSQIALSLDSLPVWTDANDASLWVEILEGTNHVPAQIQWAQRRNPGHRYVWEYDDTGVRVWRTA